MNLPAIDAFLENYEEILDYLSGLSKTELTGSFNLKQHVLASSHLKSMESFMVYFMLRVLQKLLFIVNPVHVQVQKRGLSVSQFRDSFEFLISNLSQDASNDNGINAFVDICMSEGRRLGLTEPARPRKTKRSKIYHYMTTSCSNENAELEDVNSYLRGIYKSVFHHTVEELSSRYS